MKPRYNIHPEKTMICLDKRYSTTRCVTTEKPEIIKKPQDKFETLLFLPPAESRKGEGGLRTRGYFKRSYPNKPLISVITVVLNGEKYLEETILSVLNQTYDNVEYIIIDGGSTDGTLDIIKKYEHAIDYWVSEKDRGIYDAMNKGIILSTGEIVGIVNSDDYIYKDTLSEVAHLLYNTGADYTYGSVDLLNKDGIVYGTFNSLNENEIHYRKYETMPYPHQTLYVKLQVYKTLGLYNTKYKLSSDYDFVLKLIENKHRGAKLQKPVGCFRDGGRSGGYKTFLENAEIVRSRGVSKMRSYKTAISSLIKVFLAKHLPFKVYKFLKKFRKHSKISLK